MTLGVQGPAPLQYLGPMTNVIPIKQVTRRPLPADKNFPRGQMFLLGKAPTTGSQGELWYLAYFDTDGDAVWVQFQSGASADGIDSITTDSGGAPVVPDMAGNVNVLGGTGIDVTGTGPGDTVTITVDGDLVTTQYDADSGSAVPSSGILNVLGAGSVTTSGSGSTITITAAAGGLSWITVTDATYNAAVNKGYFADRATGVTFTLPATASVGEIIEFTDIDGGGWTIAQNAGQTIQLGSSATTTGVGGAWLQQR